MDTIVAAIGNLSRRERSALRAALLAAVAAAGREARDDEELARLVAAAPVTSIPPAAELHRVGGTVLRGLDAVMGLPASVLQQLSVQRQRALLRHLMATAQLGAIARAFDELGLAWIVMKGPVAASLLYPDPGDRTYGDVDILVARHDYGRAMHALEELGFEHSIHNWALAEQMLAGQVSMATASLSVDLHWHLHYSESDRRPYALDPESMIERRRPVTVSGLSVPTLDPVDTLITLAFHAARSDGHRILWLKDIERAIAVETPDLDEVVTRCRAYRCGAPVGVMLRRAAVLIEAAVPDDIVSALTGRSLLVADRAVTGLTHPVQFHERPTLTRTFTRSVRGSAWSSVTASPARGVRRIRRRLFPPAEHETDDPYEKASFLSAVARSRD